MYGNCEKHGTPLKLQYIERGKSIPICEQCAEDRSQRMAAVFAPVTMQEGELKPECWCEQCGKGYQVASSNAHSAPDFCSRRCEAKWEAAREIYASPVYLSSLLRRVKSAYFDRDWKTVERLFEAEIEEMQKRVPASPPEAAAPSEDVAKQVLCEIMTRLHIEFEDGIFTAPAEPNPIESDSLSELVEKIANLRDPPEAAALSDERKEEIETIQKLCRDSLAFSKNKNFTQHHRDDCRREHAIFTRILQSLQFNDEQWRLLEGLRPAVVTSDAGVIEGIFTSYYAALAWAESHGMGIANVRGGVPFHNVQFSSAPPSGEQLGNREAAEHG